MGSFQRWMKEIYQALTAVSFIRPLGSFPPGRFSFHILVTGGGEYFSYIGEQEKKTRTQLTNVEKY
jgi:hypothetical protein